MKPWNGSPGTRIEVRHLFFNVPVRKKFLKSVATELGHVCETVTRLALANPALHLTLRHNGRLVYDIPASAGLLDRIALFFGGEVRDALYEIDSGPGPVRADGVHRRPEVRPRQREAAVPVRQRPLVPRPQHRARAAGGVPRPADDRPLRGRVPVPDAPAGQGRRERPPDEGRGAVPGELARLLAGAERGEDAAAEGEPGPATDGAAGGKRSGVRSQESASRVGRRAVPVAATRGHSPQRDESPPCGTSPCDRGPSDRRRVEQTYSRPSPWRAEGASAPRVEPPPRCRSRRRKPGRRAPPLADSANPVAARAHCDVGSTELALSTQRARRLPLAWHTAIQIHDSYLVLETADGMLVIDQHALHERILFEQLRRRIRDGQARSAAVAHPRADRPARGAGGARARSRRRAQANSASKSPTSAATRSCFRATRRCSAASRRTRSSRAWSITC